MQPLTNNTLNKSNSITAKGPSEEKKAVMERFCRYEDTIRNLQSQLRKEQKKVRSIKEQFSKSVGEKQEIEEILKECIDDLKMDVIKVKSETRTTFMEKSKGSGFNA